MKEGNKVRGKDIRYVTHPQPDQQSEKLMSDCAAATSKDSLFQNVREGLKNWEDHRWEIIVSALCIEDISGIEITKEDLYRANKNGKSTALGEDGVTYEILNCLACIDDRPLLHLYSMSLKEG